MDLYRKADDTEEIDREIKAVSTYGYIEDGDLPGRTVIVVNGIRSNPAIITALANGADRVVVVDNIEDAIAMKRQFEGFSLLCGAYNMDEDNGYDMGNSPQEYDRETVEGKVIVHCTTNGSRAINACASGALVLIGSMVNATAVAQAAIERENDVLIVGSGIDGRLSLEDTFAAGCIINRILKAVPNTEINDTAQMMDKLYGAFRDRPAELLAGLKTFDSLIENGFANDVAYCLSEDVLPAVPVFSEGIITLI